MALFNYAKREINAKIVYYGPGLCGKTTNIQYVFNKLSPQSKGKLLSLATQTDRTLFFDFLPVELGEIKGFKTRFHLYTVPGQVFYNATRKMVLKGVDGVVFVADSQRDMMDANLESLRNLKENLAEYELRLEDVPYVIQCNKRDLPGVVPLEEMDRLLNQEKVPLFGASAVDGKGVLPTLTTICKMVLRKLRSTQGMAPEEPVPERRMGDSYRELRKTAVRLDRPGPRPAAAGTVMAEADFPLPPLALETCGRPRIEGENEIVLPLAVRLQGRLEEVVLRIRLDLADGRPVAEVVRLEEKS